MVASRAALQLIEWTLNSALSHDKEQAFHLAAHEGKTLRLVFLPISLTVFLTVHHQQITLATQHDGTSHVDIMATPLAVLQLIRTKAPVSPKDMHISGDMLFAQTIKFVFTHLSIDWEEILSRYTGDNLAHAIVKPFRQLNNYKNHLKQSVMRSSKDYLHEELQIFPTRTEINNFLNDVDRLRDDSARFAERLKILEKRLPSC